MTSPERREWMLEHALRIAQTHLDHMEFCCVYEDDDVLEGEPSEAELREIFDIVLTELVVGVDMDSDSV